jgi:hypothetical protein
MNKAALIFLTITMLVKFSNGQSLVFHENFELPSGADSVFATTLGAQNWATNTTYFHDGARSFHKEVSIGDSSTVTTLSFSTLGYSHVKLSFHHICKIHFSDKAEIYVSNNNGSSWVKLTDTFYLGNSNFGAFGSVFTALSYTDWEPAADTATPSNAWWKHEQFDISSLVYQAAQVKIMFVLRDGDNQGSNSNFGWLIDDIAVMASNSELIPPVINITSTLLDTTYSTFAYPITAEITDASGIDAAYLVYTVNGSTPDTIGMTWMYGSMFTVSIPSQPFNSLVCFKLIAIDSSASQNMAMYPASGCRNILILQGPNMVTIGSGTVTNTNTTYPAPYGNRFWGARHQFLITASELNAAGLSPGYLTSLGFNVITAQGTNLSGFTIKMGHTQANALSSTFNESLMTVYYVPTYAESVGWSNHTFQTPFFWDGVNNIMIDVCFNNSSNTNNAIVQQSLTTYPSTLFARDNLPGICSKSNGTLINQRPNIRFTTPVYNSNNDAGIAGILLQGMVPANTSINLDVWVRNYGLDTLQKAQVFYAVNNGAAVGPFIWTGSLLQGMNSAAFNLGTVSFPIGYNTLNVWTALPNDSADQNTINDALTVYLYACPQNISGSYSVGGVNPDFQTLDDALASITTCGLSGHVVLNMAPGIYPGQYTFTNIPGISDSTTLTIRSATGDPEDVVFLLSTTGNDNYTIRFYNAEYIILKQLTVRSTNSTLGRVIYFDGDSRHITIDSCIIETPIGTASSSVPISANTSSAEYNIKISNSFINGGFQGITFVGSTTIRKNKIILYNNTIESFHSNGIFINNIDSVSIISNNIKNGTLSGTKRAIYFTNANGFNEISKNKVILQGVGSSTIYGIYIQGKTGMDYLEVANNFIVHSGSTGETHGIYVTTSSYVNIFYNSVNITAGASSTGRAFTQAGSGGNLNVINNIFCNTGGGYVYYVATPSSIVSSNYNNFYNTGNNMAFWSGNRTSLIALQSASGKDTNSQNILPPFTAFNDLHLASSALSNKAIYLPSVPDDIDGSIRTLTPTIGAHEIPFIAFDAGVIAFIYPGTSTVINQSDSVSPVVIVKNLGFDTINSMVIAYQINNGNPVIHNYTGPLFPAFTDTIALPSFISPVGNNLISAYTILVGDSNTFNDTCYFSFYASPALDGQLSRIIPEESACGMGSDTLKIVIANVSANNSPITNCIASYQIMGSQVTYTDTISATILPGDSIVHLFQSLVDYSVTIADSIFTIKAWIEVPGDNSHNNDTAIMSVKSRYIPDPPVVTNDTISFGSVATLYAQSPNTVFWYPSDTATIPFHSGTSYITPLLYNTTIYWVEATTTVGNNGIATVGSGTTTASTSGPIVISATSGYVYSQHISILSPSELSNISGYITSLAWHKTNNGAYTSPNAEMRIYLKHTNLSSIPSAAGSFASEVAGAMLFYESTTQTIPSSIGWKEFESNAPQQFLYNGTSNLMILIDWFRPGGATGPVEWSYSLTQGKAQTWAAGSTPPIYGSGSGERPNVKVTLSAMEGCESARIPVYAAVSTAPPNDAGVIAVLNPGSTVPTGSNTSLQVRVKNYGLNNLTSVEIHHRINGVLMAPYMLTGINLPKDSLSQPITLSTTVYPIGSYFIEVWTSMPNGLIDGANMNDTMVHNFVTCLSGSYTLGSPTSDFTTFTSALNALNTYPLCGHVIFDIAPGTYNQQLNITPSVNSGQNTTVTFQSATGDSTDVVIQFATTSSNNRVLKLDGVQHFIFRKMTLHATGLSQGRVIEFLNGASYITIANCVIKTSNTSTGTAFAGVFCDYQSVSHHVVISKNLFIGGYNGISWTGNTGLYIKNHLVIEYNIIEDFYSTALFNRYTDSIYIIGNSFANRPGAGTIYGLYIQYPQGYGEIMKNRINLQSPSIQYGISVMDKSTSSNQYITIANNFISATGAPLIAVGLETDNANYVNLYYNNVNINGGDATNGMAAFIHLGSNVRLRNNCLVNVGGGYACYVYATGNVSQSDYNNFFTTGPVLAYWGSSAATLTVLKSISGKDGNSISVNPLYQSNSNLIPAVSSGLYQAGDAISGIIDDIFGNPRPPMNPCIGAVEFVPSQNDAGLVAITSPGASVSGSDSIVVTLKNWGAGILNSVNINWQINGLTQAPYMWTGNLSSNASQPGVNIGTYSFSSGSYNIKVWVSLPNGQPDGFANNDTVYKNVIACNGSLRGVYTIGGLGAHFINFNAAVNALVNCGIDSATVFLVNSGHYIEQMEIPSIQGASLLNPITFRSLTGDSTDVVIEFTATGAQAAHAVLLNGAKFIRFELMTLKTSGTVGGRTVVLRNGSEHNSFEGCIIQAPLSSQPYFSCVYSDNLSVDQFNVFKGNRILDGYHGFYIVGSSTNRKNGFVIENNQITGYYYYGIYALYTDSIIIQKNTLTNSTPAATTGYHIYVYYNQGVARISQNKVHSTIQLNSAGIVFGFATSVPSIFTEISNNFVSQIGMSTAFKGISVSGTNSRVNIFNNSVSVMSNNASGGCLHISGGQVNIFCNNLSNTGIEGYALRIDSLSYIIASDHNNFYTTGMKFISIGYDCPNLTYFQGATLLDSNSVSTPPMFNSSSDLHSVSPILDGAGKPLPGIFEDIDGDLRDPIAPDIGADEFSIQSKDIGPILVLSPTISSSYVSAVLNVSVRIRNHGSDTLTSFDLAFEYAGFPKVNGTWVGQLFPGQTVDYTFPTSLSLVLGSHNLKIYTELSGDQNTGNDTIFKLLTGQPVINLPWSDAFDVQPNLWAEDGGLWQHGVPSGAVIDTPYSSPYVWATNLIGQYPAGVNAFLYSPFFNFSFANGAVLSFMQWREIPDNNDGGQLHVSTDGGNTWQTLGFSGDPLGSNWYNHTAGGQHCFTGNTNGWIQSTFDLNAFNQFTTFVQFRFRFFSNISGTGEGWAIDNFSISLPVYPLDAAVQSVDQPSGSTLNGSLVTVQTTIRNHGSTTITTLPLGYRVNNQPVVNETWSGTLLPDSSATFTFATPYTSPNNPYNLCVFTKLPGDQNPLNDTVCVTLNTTLIPLDAGIEAIIEPSTTSIAQTQITVKARIKNFGSQTLTTIPLEYSTGLIINSESWSGVLLPGSSVDYSFTNTLLGPVGPYTICVRTNLVNDGDTANDHLCINVLGVTGIDESAGKGFSVMQNRPNPFNGITDIELFLPEPGEVIFTITDMVGNTIRRDLLWKNYGAHIIHIDLEGIPSGIYFYTVEFRGERIVKKMVVL